MPRADRRSRTEAVQKRRARTYHSALQGWTLAESLNWHQTYMLRSDDRMYAYHERRIEEERERHRKRWGGFRRHMGDFYNDRDYVLMGFENHMAAADEDFREQLVAHGLEWAFRPVRRSHHYL